MNNMLVLVGEFLDEIRTEGFEKTSMTLGRNLANAYHARLQSADV